MPRETGGLYNCACGSEFCSTRRNQYECSTCSSTRQRQRRANNPGLSAQYDKTWRERHPDAAKQKWVRRRDREPTLHQSLMRIMIKARASITNPKTPGRRDFAFDLTIGFMLELWATQDGHCAMSGQVMDLFQGKRATLKSVSIDRKDNAVGYLQTNIQLVCRWANLGRGRFSVEEMVAVINELRGQ